MLSNIYKHTFNCGNIRYSPAFKWLGQTGRYKGFCKFESSDFGLRALVVLVRNYIRMGYDTVGKILNRYAPNSENDLVSYFSYIWRCSGLKETDFIKYKSHEFYCLLYCIAHYETGFTFTELELEYLYKKFDL